MALSKNEDFIDLLAFKMDAEWLEHLERCRENGRRDFEDPNWMWNAFVLSAATLGRVPNSNKLTALRAGLNWDRVCQWPEDERISNFVLDLRNAGVRFPNRKAKWLVKNSDWIRKNFNSPESAKATWQRASLPDAIDMLTNKEKIAGVGEKYARNIGMDVADERFDDCAALDARIRSILKKVDCGLNIHDNWPNRDEYAAGERYIQSLAMKLSGIKNIKITAWQVDRTLFFRHLDFCALAGIANHRQPRIDRYCRTSE